jgi:hypothetical protein
MILSRGTRGLCSGAPRPFLQEFYGTVAWSVRAIYAHYAGWFDGNPTKLFPLPERDRAARVIELAGGREQMLSRARRALDEKDFHWAAEAHRAAGLKLIPTMAKECRKYGISLIVASQEAKGFNVSLFSAIANYLVLRLTEVDAKALVRNVASSQQERVLIDKIKQMDRFKALYFSEGKSRPSPISLLP